jgi:SOS response regulatory protein OraA/RecX
MAHHETEIKHHGRLRVRRQIENAGIARDTARRAVNEAFAGLDEGMLLEVALAKRLRTRETIDSDAEFQRLYRYLIAQGFEADAVMKVLTDRRRRR